MRRLFSLIVLVGVLCLAGVAEAEFPRLLSFQGRLDDTAGVPLPDGDYTITFRLFDEPDFGIALWEETQSVQTAAGVFAALLGAVDSIPNVLFDLDSLYLEVQPAGSGVLVPRTRLTMVPYAWRAFQSERLGGVTADDITLHFGDPSAHHEKTTNASELTVGTLAEGRLPQGAIDSTEIEGESIAANRLADEPGIAHSSTALKTLSTTVAPIDSITVTLPAGGYVLLRANGWFYKFHTNGTGDSFSTVSLSTQRNIQDENYSAKFTVLSSEPSGHTNENFCVSRVMSVGPGQLKVYLVGGIIGSSGPRVERVHLTALFFPTAYGDIDLTPQ